MYTACLWTCFGIDSKLDSLQQQKYIAFAEFLPLIYPPELEIKETTDTASSASYLDLYPEFDDSGQLSTKINDKRDDFNFNIILFFKYVQQYTSFSCIWCLHLAIHSLCKGQ
jgi:hypothetical protein